MTVIDLPLWGQALGTGIFLGWCYFMLKMSDSKHPGAGWVGHNDQ